MKEAQARIKINKLLEAAGWRFLDDASGRQMLLWNCKDGLRDRAQHSLGRWQAADSGDGSRRSAEHQQTIAQGLVSATSVLSDRELRKAANKKLPPTHQFTDPEQRIDPAKYEVCYAIGSADPGKLVLPFFSRVTLRNAYRLLTQSYGFNVSLTKITVSKLTKLK